MDTDPVLLCRALGGVATAELLRRNGVGRAAVLAAVRDGRLEVVRRGVFADSTLPESVRHALRHAGRLACHSMLKARGVWTLDDADLHIHLGPGGHVRERGCCTPVLHRSTARAAGGPAAVSVLSALGELGRCRGPEHLIVAVDSARNLGLLADHQLPVLRAATSPELRPVIDFSTGLADSGLESLVRWRLHLRGVLAVPQHVLSDRGKRDLLIGDRLLIETDGGSHDTAEQRRLDARRDAYATAAGYIVLRFDYRQVVHAWHELEAAIFAIIDRGLHLAPTF